MTRIPILSRITYTPLVLLLALSCATTSPVVAPEAPKAPAPHQAMVEGVLKDYLALNLEELPDDAYYRSTIGLYCGALADTILRSENPTADQKTTALRVANVACQNPMGGKPDELEVALKACGHALDLHAALGTPKEVIADLNERRCRVEFSQCIHGASDAERCRQEAAACKGAK